MNFVLHISDFVTITVLGVGIVTTFMFFHGHKALKSLVRHRLRSFVSSKRSARMPEKLPRH
jgi:hypothetical protein